MDLPNWFSWVPKMLESFYAMQAHLDHINEDLRVIKGDDRQSQKELSDLKARVAALEAERKAVDEHFQSKLDAAAIQHRMEIKELVFTLRQAPDSIRPYEIPAAKMIEAQQVAETTAIQP